MVKNLKLGIWDHQIILVSQRASLRGIDQLMSCSACRGDCIVTEEA